MLTEGELQEAQQFLKDTALEGLKHDMCTLWVKILLDEVKELRLRLREYEAGTSA